MEVKATDIVMFTDALEEGISEKHYGILFENGFILCLCCGGYVEPEEYIIIEHCDWNNVYETLVEYIRDGDPLVRVARLKGGNNE